MKNTVYKKPNKAAFSRLKNALRSGLDSLFCLRPFKARNPRIPELRPSAFSRLENALRSNCLLALLRSRFAMFSHSKLCLSAFSLGEVMVVLSLLGIVAAISIPSLNNRYQITVSKTKIKSAINTFDSLMRLAAAESRTPSNQSIINTLKLTSDGKCAGLKNYLKVVNQTNCTISTSDGVWWNFSDNDTSANNGIFVKVARSKADLDKISSKTTNYYPYGAWFYAIQTNDGLFINNEQARSSAPALVRSNVGAILTNLNKFTE